MDESPKLLPKREAFPKHSLPSKFPEILKFYFLLCFFSTSI